MGYMWMGQTTVAIWSLTKDQFLERGVRCGSRKYLGERAVCDCWRHVGSSTTINPTTCCVLSTLEAQLGGLSKQQPYENMLTTPFWRGQRSLPRKPTANWAVGPITPTSSPAYKQRCDQ